MAAVPIVRATHHSGINIDVNVNERLGYKNSKLIWQYTQLSPLIVPMVYFIKLWVKTHKITVFTNYALMIMIIGYLQASSSVYADGLIPM